MPDPTEEVFPWCQDPVSAGKPCHHLSSVCIHRVDCFPCESSERHLCNLPAKDPLRISICYLHRLLPLGFAVLILVHKIHRQPAVSVQQGLPQPKLRKRLEAQTLGHQSEAIRR